MHVVVLGLWHLGSVTAACVARHHRVTGLDFDETIINGLRQGHAPLHEPGLDALLAEGVAAGRLGYSSEVTAAAKADVLWICHDTPVDADDRSDLNWVMARLARVLPSLRQGTVVLISSQLPVGTSGRLAAEHPSLHFACSPENLRLGKAIEAFENPSRIVVGAPEGEARIVLEKLFAPIGAPILWMRPASAEMVKHALNSFLALSVAYINEIGILSEAVGADAMEVAAGLKSDPRIGQRAYLNPGGPFAGGTLARDVVTLSQLGARHELPISLIPSIKQSNDGHRRWPFRKLTAALAGCDSPVVAVLGLAYTPNTSTLRRSAAIELCRQLLAAGIKIRAFDPLVRSTDEEHSDIPLVPSAEDAIRGANALVICTACPEFRTYPWSTLIAQMSNPVVVDANRTIEKAVAALPGLVYLTVGRP